MIVAFWFLLLMYIGLTLLYIFTQTKPTAIPPWPLLPVPPSPSQSIINCNMDADCEPHQVCLGGTCVPKLLRGDDCNPSFGQWISYTVQKANFAICSCFNDQLFSQNVFGGDCNVNVGCGAHGRYLEADKKCDCDPGYTAVGLTCQKLPILEHLNLLPCEPNEIRVSDLTPADGFHADYLKRLSPATCVKWPCSFDALSGRPLKYTRYDPEWGCVCDPRFGLFGVTLQGPGKQYLTTEGFDACASLFTQDPQDPINVKLVTYFFLGDREPISIILFENVQQDYLIPTLRRQGDHLMIRQSPWRYDFAQHFFKHNPEFHARTRQVYKVKLFNTEIVNDAIYVDTFEPFPCDMLPAFWQYRPHEKPAAYELLYKSPVCRVGKYDAAVDPQFQERVIVNPNHLTFDQFPDLPRFNAFVLHYQAAVGLKRWSLDLDYPFNVDGYRAIKTNAPNYS